MIPNDLGPREVQDALDQKWTNISSSSEVRATDQFDLADLADDGDPDDPSPGITAGGSSSATDLEGSQSSGSKKAAAAGAALIGAGYLLTK